MLGKLIKHEIIADTRIFLPSYVAVLVVALMGRFLTWLSTRKYIVDHASYSFSHIIQWASSLLSVIYFLLFVGVIFLTVFYVIYRFYKNYFTDEGYLMMTLPTKTTTLVTSKFLTAVIWLVVGGLVTMLSIYITLGHVEAIQNLIKELKDTISLILTTNENLFEDYLGVPTGVFLAELAIIFVVAGARFILSWYFSIAFGQLIAKDHKIAGAVLSFLAIDIATQILTIIFLNAETSVLSNFITDIGTNTGHAMQSIIIGAIVFLLILIAVMFGLTCRIMNRKLNLD